MAASFTLPTVLANLTAGNQPLSLIDGDLNALANPLLALGTFSNYYTDTGSANAYAITVSAPQTVSQAAGLRIQFLAGNSNTAASTFQINALPAKNVKNLDGTALTGSQILANSIVDVIYDGTEYLLLNAASIFSTWAPALGGSATYTNQVGLYEKYGKRLNYWGRLIINAIGTGSVTTVSGLPATSANSGMNYPGSVGYFASLASNTIFLAPVVTVNAATITFNGLAASGSTMSQTINVFQNSTEIVFSGSYEVA